jgi:DNA-binding CsgD family transcriptional regulator
VLASLLETSRALGASAAQNRVLRTSLARWRAKPSTPRIDAGPTPTERDVIALVLQRHTNAEIARQLFMAKRTVELHLTRVFRQVGVARQSQLIERETVRELVGAPSR